ncbi:MAG: ScpA family protein [Candidatus Paceibacterota bacterium]
METETIFKVKQDVFEGPVEVLLELIEKRKLFVNDVSLAAVTDDFIQFMQTVGMQAGETAIFLAVAATLILIKARSLLPNLELSPEEAESITDLERRVALYQIISHVSADLIKAYGKKVSFEGVRRLTGVVFAPDEKLTLDQLPQLIAEMLGRVPPPVAKKPEARVYKTISITEVLSTLQERIERAMSTSFNAIRVASPDMDDRSQKVYTIVSFLGMLELVRRGIVAAEQSALFEDITLQKSEAPVEQQPFPSAESLYE